MESMTGVLLECVSYCYYKKKKAFVVKKKENGTRKERILSSF